MEGTLVSNFSKSGKLVKSTYFDQKLSETSIRCRKVEGVAGSPVKRNQSKGVSFQTIVGGYFSSGPLQRAATTTMDAQQNIIKPRWHGSLAHPANKSLE
jgi:hypothetical protein